jgi:drug/metabolite transporter (DMT)-like permease
LKLLKKNLIHNKAFQGEAYIFAASMLASFLPIFSILAFKYLPPLYTAGMSMLMAALFFVFILTVRKQWKEIKSKSALKDIVISGLVRVVYYSLIFIGLTKTTAGNASIMLLMEVFFSMFILGLWKKEKLVLRHKFGAILMVIGALFVLFRGNFQVNEGDLIILISTVIPPIGNYFAQTARKKVGTSMILFLRNLIAGMLILFLAVLFEVMPTSTELANSAIFIIVNGIFLLGLAKIFWLEAIHRIPITKVTSLSSLEPAFTLFFAYFILAEIPTIWQILGFLPMLFGIVLLTEYKFKSSIKTEL